MPARSWGCAQVWSKVRSLGRHLGATCFAHSFLSRDPAGGSRADRVSHLLQGRGGWVGDPTEHFHH